MNNVLRNKEWLEFYQKLGVKTIPMEIVNNIKKPLVKYAHLKEINEDVIQSWHSQFHNATVIGAVLDASTIVLDVDTKEAEQALDTIQKRHGLVSNFVVNTQRGKHHYFKLPTKLEGKVRNYGSHEKSSIDIRCQGGVSILPPSMRNGEVTYTIFKNEINDFRELVEVSSEFLEDVCENNGQLSLIAIKKNRCSKIESEASFEDWELVYLKKLLNEIDPSVGYSEWFEVLCSAKYKFGDDVKAFDIIHEWCERGTNYDSRKDVHMQLEAIDVTGGITFRTLEYKVRDSGVNVERLMTESKVTSYPRVSSRQPNSVQVNNNNPVILSGLSKFSLNNRFHELKSLELDAKFILGRMALLGQFTVIYAKYNSGKTLITIKELINSVDQGVINGGDVFYINADDYFSGLLDKTEILKSRGIQVVTLGFGSSDNYQFKPEDLITSIREWISLNQARGKVIILDTVKKFVDLMNKTVVSKFTTSLREFTSAGGTIIALAHTNKSKDLEGKSVHAGTSDLADDSDCVFILEVVSVDDDQKTVCFRNEKSRGAVDNLVYYKYSNVEGVPYRKIFESVERCEDFDKKSSELCKLANENKDIVASIQEMIVENYPKTKIIYEAHKLYKSEISRNKLTQIFDKLTGPNFEKGHRWKLLKKGDNNSHYYQVINSLDD